MCACVCVHTGGEKFGGWDYSIVLCVHDNKQTHSRSSS